MKRLVLLVVLALFPAGNAWAQAAGQISGTVTDAAGAPLAGAAVSAAGRGAVTGADGKYTITGVPAGTHAVRATRVGHTEGVKRATVAAGQTATVNFRLAAQVIQLEEIVATGYGTQRKKDVTGAVASVRAEEIKQVPTPNAIEAIKGKVAGVDIVTDGFHPGAGVRVRVRGARSIRAGNDPLYVVDGIPLAGGIQDFNPANIQSIEVLKDASATAIYGSRGANGVVLITTNQGRRGDTRITYETYYGLQNQSREVEMMTGPEFATLKREAYRTVGKYQCPAGTPMNVGCEAGDRDLFTPEELAGLQGQVSTNWQDLIRRTGVQQNHQVNISGGNEDTRFSVSGNFYDNAGITKGMDFTRKTGSVSLDHNTGRLKIGTSATLSNSAENFGPGNGMWGLAMRQNPLGSPLFEDGTPNPQPVPDGLMWNPLLDLEHVHDEDVRTRIFGSLWGELRLAEGVTLRSNFGPDLTFRHFGNFAGSMSGRHRASGNSDARLMRDQIWAYTLSNFLTVDRGIGDDHHVNTTLLYEIQEEDYQRNEGRVSQLPYEHQLFYNLGSAGQIEGVDSRFSEWKLQSYMGRVNYSFRDKYLLTLTGRMDGSSRLAQGNKYSFFPSVALAWRAGDEPFIADLGLFSDLKLRASYGRTGNTSISPYQTQGGLCRTRYSFDGGAAFGYRPCGLSNPALEWEKTDQYDVGVDFGVLDNRVTGTVDYYVQNTYDLLLNRQLPTFTGFGSILENIGETRNTGVEVALSTINLEGWNGLRWTTDFAWSTNKNEIVSLYGGKEDDVGSRWFIGQPINVYYDYQMLGIWQLDEAEEARKYKQKPGEIKVADINGDGKITGDDRVIIGRHERFPKWYGSLSNRFEWGNFDLSALAVARWGYTLNSDFHDGFNSLFARYNNIRTNYWTPENPSNTDPRPNADQERPLYNNARQYKEGSHVRIRNITLGYSLPSSVLGRFGGESLRIYAAAHNPFIFTSYTGFDPESNESGGTGAGSPSFRTLLIGASVGF